MGTAPKPLPSLDSLQRGEVLRLHLGELDANELRVAQAAVRFCYSKLVPSFSGDDVPFEGAEHVEG